MTIAFKKDEIILLLGAGASVEANIPASQGMIDKIESLLAGAWSRYRDLYYFIRSAIQFADGIKGRFDSGFNVEQLVGTLDDLRLGDRHPLFPFIGAWVPKLFEVAGADLSTATEFRNIIVRQLRDDWVQLKYREDAAYYAGFSRFQRELQDPLRLFSLNYDLCVEATISDAAIERGFNEEKKWDWRRFDEGRIDPPDIYLYKLHGSIDWRNDDTERLEYLDAISQIEPNQLSIIFGTTYKLQAADPFLFFAYEFRRWTLEMARLIVAIGYGFADGHINSIIKQSLRRNPERKLLAITYIREDPEKNENLAELEVARAAEIAEAIGLGENESGQIVCKGCGAGEFISNQLNLNALAELFPDEEHLFDEIAQMPTALKDEDVEMTDLGINSPDRNGAASLAPKSNVPSGEVDDEFGAGIF